MGFWDSLFGVSRQGSAPAPRRGRPPTADEYAVDRYRYLLRTAPPEEVEKVHAEAFAKLTPEQRHLLHDQLTAAVMVDDRPADDSPETLARSATRAELREPGTMANVLGSSALGQPFGSGFGSSLLGSVAGYFVASSLMQAFLPPVDTAAFYDQGYAAGYDDGAATDAGVDGGYDSGFDGGFDGGGDFAGFDGGFDF